MTLAEPLEALIKLAVVYVILSIALSAVVELVFQLLRIRGRVLANTVKALIGDEAIKDFYNEPIIDGLRQRGWVLGQLTEKIRAKVPGTDKSRTPHFIEQIDGATFASAVVNMQRNGGSIGSRLAALNNDKGELQPSRLTLWYEQAIKAARRQYRRSVQIALLVTGFILAWVADIDSLQILKKAFSAGDAAAADWSSINQWLGYLLTAAAVALGSQYWFDVIGQLLGLRRKVQSIPGVWGRAAKRP